MLKDKSLEQMFSELTPQESSAINGGLTFQGNGVWRSTDGSIGSFGAFRGVTYFQCANACGALGTACTGIEYSVYINPAQGPSMCELHSDAFGSIGTASGGVNIAVLTNP